MPALKRNQCYRRQLSDQEAGLAGYRAKNLADVATPRRGRELASRNLIAPSALRQREALVRTAGTVTALSYFLRVAGLTCAGVPRICKPKRLNAWSMTNKGERPVGIGQLDSASTGRHRIVGQTRDLAHRRNYATGLARYLRGAMARRMRHAAMVALIHANPTSNAAA